MDFEAGAFQSMLNSLQEIENEASEDNQSQTTKGSMSDYAFDSFTLAVSQCT